MDDLSSSVAGIVVVRVWHEDATVASVRGRITYVADVRAPKESTEFAHSVDGICDVVRRLLLDFETGPRGP